jgi:hypothetical protein
MKRFAFLLVVSLLLAACSSAKPTAEPTCVPVEARPNAAKEGIDAGAVVVYERIGKSTCIDEVWSFFPDGKIVGDKETKTATPEEIATLVKDIEQMGFFKLESTKHTACQKCFTYNITVKSGDQVKTVSAVDGGTDTPTEYWQIFAKIKKLLPATQ